MARIAKTVATATTGTRQNFSEMTKTIKGFITLDEIKTGVNSNGKEFLIIPGFGVTYFRISEIKAGVKYGVIQFPSNQEGNEGALALNKISGKEELKYYMNEFPGQSMSEVKELFGIIL